MKKLILITALASGLFVKGQIIERCGNAGIPLPTIGGAQASCLSAGSSGDYYSNLYIPNASMPTLQFRLNFIFLVHPTQQTFYGNATYNDLDNAANLTISSLNSQMANCGNVTSYLTPVNPSPLVPNPKIQFVKNNVYIVTDAALSIGPYFGNPAIYTTYPYTSDNSVNIYFYTETYVPNAGSAYVPGKGIAVMANPTVSDNLMYGNPPFYVPGNIVGGGLLWHELGHAIGLFPDFYDLYYDNNGNTLPPTPAQLPKVFANSDPANGGYFPDDATYDLLASYDCTNPLDPTYPYSNNNLMGNSFCRQVLSARQIAAFHYLVAKNVTKKYTQFNGIPYPYTPFNSTPNAYTFSGTQIITSLPTPFSIITIPAGADITINNTLLSASQNAKIIVEQNAKLTLNCCKIESFNYGELWEGIEVWGNSALNQLPANQGLIEVNNSVIKDAIVGITNCKKLAIGVDLNTTGGIIQSTNSTFNNNQISIDMYPYASYKKGNRKSELSFVKTSTFNIDLNYKGIGVTQAPYAHIRTEDVYGLQILGCTISGDNNMIGIYGLNSRLILKDYCANPISPTNCGSAPVQNNFNTLGKCIYLQNTTSTNYSIIDHAIFNNNPGTPSGHVYVNKVDNIELINNQFYVDAFNSLTQPNYGLYLNNCNGYAVENNEFISPTGSAKKVGLYVNNSGPNANSIYNNTFTGLQQGLWALNQNFDPFTGNGLVMNCNDFTGSNIYNIGIQKTNKSLLGAPNNTGVNTTQGITIGTPDQNVRNTYNVSACNNNAENKYYIGTGNSFAIASHGSFLGSQWHPTPQTSNSCSNASEITDIIGGAAPGGGKAVYCPLNYLSSFGNRALGSAISTNRANAANISSDIAANLDGGNTQTLLNAINSNISSGQLKNQLMAPTYLSDTVLKTYFKKPNVPNGHLKDVFVKNAPVTNPVWQVVQTLNLPNGIFNQIQTAQNQNALSARAAQQSQLQLAQKELGLLTNEKMRRLILDTSGVQVDSILAIYDLKELPNSAFDAVNLLISSGRYADAGALIADLNAKSPANNNFCRLSQYALALAQAPKIWKNGSISQPLRIL
jgi:hypothetical protein